MILLKLFCQSTCNDSSTRETLSHSVRKKIVDPDQAMAIASKIKLTEAAKVAGLRKQDAAGLLFDRDTVVFYGDPAWKAKLADGELAYEQTLKREKSTYTFKVNPMRGKKSFEPINTNGSQRGWRPIVHFFDKRIRK